MGISFIFHFTDPAQLNVTLEIMKIRHQFQKLLKHQYCKYLKSIFMTAICTFDSTDHHYCKLCHYELQITSIINYVIQSRLLLYNPYTFLIYIHAHRHAQYTSEYKLGLVLS
jgi:hypothetical protein